MNASQKHILQAASQCRRPGSRAAFTLIELVVVIATLLLLAAMIAPALAGAKNHSQSDQCQMNLKQLATAWIMYANNNNDKIALNGDESVQPSTSSDPLTQTAFQSGGTSAQWCPGNMQQTLSSAQYYWNTNCIKAGMIYPYIQSIIPYHCPTDQYHDGVPARLNGVPTPFHERSYSMNCWMNPANWYLGGTPPPYLRYQKLSQIVRPGPSMAWVFIEESPLSIDDGYFDILPTGTEWVNAPAVSHGQSSVLTFADGHSEWKKWTDPALIQNTGANGDGSNFQEDSPADLNWLQQRTTAHQ